MTYYNGKFRWFIFLFSIFAVSCGLLIKSSGRNLGASDVPKSAVEKLTKGMPGTLVSSSWGDPRQNGFRLTGVSGTPVVASNQASISTIYLTPYTSNRIALLNTSTQLWDLHKSAEISLAISGATAGTPEDVYVFDNSGTLVLQFESWSDPSTPSVKTVVDGVLVNSTDRSLRYVGTFRPRSASTTSWIVSGVDAAVALDIWNVDNRVRVGFQLVDSTNSWTYASTTVRQVRGTASNKVELIVGHNVLDMFEATALASTVQNNTGYWTGIGYNSTTTKIGLATQDGVQPGVWTRGTSIATVRHTPGIGIHYYAWLESSLFGSATVYGDDGGTVQQSGLTGSWCC